MEAYVVQSIFFAFPEDAQPLLFVGRGIARLGETAVLNSTTQE